ncbi:hypothetical protein [Leifsonia shinshuensis]|uniref:Uncharacterized protein n=1 Tax=Leifsonia shinshuensis TaxID=150026 RepID=A0A853CU89_9MICO|nr:hypothetical protein [Leifsonia shinshuensis]NYJ23473.1 hypothetical protein [Leifsonia shinshuensis]
MGPLASLTSNAEVTYITVDNRERAEQISAALNSPEGRQKLHAEIAVKPEYAGAEMIDTTARVVELSD